MKKNKKRFLKFLTLIGTTSFIIATPIITTSCSSKNTEPQKVNLEINSTVTTVGAIDALVTNNSDTAMQNISESLTNNPDKLIQNYDAIKDKLGDDFNVIATVDSKSEEDKWGQTPYEDWKKVNQSFYASNETTIEEIIYSPNLNPMTVSSKNDFYDKLNEKLIEILKASDSTKFDNISKANLNELANIGFDNKTNLLHVKVDVSEEKAEGAQTTCKARKDKTNGELANENSTTITKSYDLCIPASEIDLNIKDLNVEISGKNINKTNTKIENYTYEIGIDSVDFVKKDFELKKPIENSKPDVNDVLTELNWRTNVPLRSTKNTLPLDQNKIASDLSLHNVTFTSPEVNGSENNYSLSLKAKPFDGFSWEDGTNNEKSINVANLTTFKKADINGLSNGTLNFGFDADGSYSDANTYFESKKDEIMQKVNETQDSVIITYKEQQTQLNDASNQYEYTANCTATPKQGYKFSDDSKSKDFSLKITFKQKVNLKSNINITGSLSDISNENVDSNISAILSKSLDKVIDSPSVANLGNVNVSIKGASSTENNKWGKIPYSEWNKNSEQSLINQKEESNISLQKLYYSSDSKLEVTSLNDLHDKITTEIQKLSVSKETNNTKYSIVNDTAIGVDVDNDLLHINIQKETFTNANGREGTQTETPSIVKYDYCVPASSITYNIRNIDITVSGDKVQTNSSKIDELKFQIGSKVNENPSYLREDLIIAGVNKEFKETLTKEDAMVSLGWAIYESAGDSIYFEESADSKTLKIDNDKISQELNIYNTTFEVISVDNDNIKQQSQPTYTLTLKATPKSGFSWSDGTNNEKTIKLNNLKFVVRGAYLRSNKKEYKNLKINFSQDINDENIKNYIQIHHEEFLNQIQTNLSTPDKEKEFLVLSENNIPNQFLKNAKLSWNKQETIDANKEIKQQINYVNFFNSEEKKVNLVFDVTPDAGFTFHNKNNTNPQKLTVTVIFCKTSIRS